MKKDFDIVKLLDGMEPEDAMEFIQSAVTPEAARKFTEGKKQAALEKQYKAEVETLGGSPRERLMQLNEIKAKYRAMGLRVF